MSWLILSIFVIVFWELWSFLVKLASNHLDWYQIFVVSNTVFLAFTVLVYFWFRPQLAGEPLAAWIYAAAAGATGALGTILFYLALKCGKASIVVPLSALYPVVAVALSLLLLHETLSFKQALGVVLAIIAILLISSS